MTVHTEPGLRAGWEPDAPAGDTLLRRYLLDAAASNAGPVPALGGRVLHRDDVVAADVGRPSGFVLNAVVLLQPLGGDRGEEPLDGRCWPASAATRADASRGHTAWPRTLRESLAASQPSRRRSRSMSSPLTNKRPVACSATAGSVPS